MNILNRINNAESGFRSPEDPKPREPEKKGKRSWARILIIIGITLISAVLLFLLFNQ